MWEGRREGWLSPAVSSAAGSGREDAHRGFPHFHPLNAVGAVGDCLQREMEYFPPGEPQENVTTSCFLWLINRRREGMTG